MEAAENMSDVHGSLLDDVDQRLLHALQVEPRASWRELAPIVGRDAATLTRRWERLQSAGLAWVTGHRRRPLTAMVEIDCAPEGLALAAADLAVDPAVITLDHCSGKRSLVALVGVADLEALSDYVTQTLGAIGGVRAVHVHPVNEIIVSGEAWRTGALNMSEAARIRPPRPPRPRAARVVQAGLRDAIEAELWLDGRTPSRVIARRHGYTEQRVSDAIAVLRRSRELIFRTDVARSVTSSPIYAWYFVEAPAESIAGMRASLIGVPEVRVAFTSPSSCNLILAVWLRKLSDLDRFESALASAVLGGRIGDRSVVLRMHRQLARVLGPGARALRVAPHPPRA